jgi:hypothetical protein
MELEPSILNAWLEENNHPCYVKNLQTGSHSNGPSGNAILPYLDIHHVDSFDAKLR